MSTDGPDVQDIDEHVQASRRAFGSVLRVALAQADMDKKTLAAKSGFAEGTIINYTKDRQTPRLNELDRLARALGISEVELFTRIVAERDRILRESE